MNELEFGKLAEKTKAMRLMHKKGISLQEAWNIVKSKKSPKKTKKIKSPKKSQKVKLENLKLKELQKLAKKYSISITQRGNIKSATKELLINRFRRSGKLKEIKSSALKMKFGAIFDTNSSIYDYKEVNLELVSLLKNTILLVIQIPNYLDSSRDEIKNEIEKIVSNLSYYYKLQPKEIFLNRKNIVNMIDNLYKLKGYDGKLNYIENKQNEILLLLNNNIQKTINDNITKKFSNRDFKDEDYHKQVDYFNTFTNFLKRLQEFDNDTKLYNKEYIESFLLKVYAINGQTGIPDM